MKILAVCQGGHIRSVAAKFLLHYGQMGTPYGQGPMHDVLCCGWQSNSQETRNMLCEWANKIIVMDERFKQFIPSKYNNKLLVFHVGDDVFGAAFHPQLMNMVWEKYQNNINSFK
jgi:hypothetical protein